MKRISAIAISLFLSIGLMAEAQAVTSGVYKCYGIQGFTDDSSTFVLPAVTHYNPNATGVQSITRIRVFNSQGGVLFDQAFPPGTNTVNARGASPTTMLMAPIVALERLQAIVNWRQAADALAPIPRLQLFLFNTTSGIYTSVSQSAC
jgi:hypothetical protein